VNIQIYDDVPRIFQKYFSDMTRQLPSDEMAPDFTNATIKVIEFGVGIIASIIIDLDTNVSIPEYPMGKFSAVIIKNHFYSSYWNDNGAECYTTEPDKYRTYWVDRVKDYINDHASLTVADRTALRNVICFIYSLNMPAVTN